MKIVIQIILWVLIIFLGFKLWNSIYEPQQFNKVKEARYAKVIKNLKDIRNAQLAHREIEGKFTSSYDSLISFVETAKFAITARRDTAYADQKKNLAYGLDRFNGGYIVEDVIIDTLGFVSVKDSLFQGTDRYKTMMNIPIEGVDAKIEMEASSIIIRDTKYSVFEAKATKQSILADLDKPDLLAQEKQVVAVEGVNGPNITVGSLEEINTSGNWPKIYDTVKDQ